MRRASKKMARGEGVVQTQPTLWDNRKLTREGTNSEENLCDKKFEDSWKVNSESNSPHQCKRFLIGKWNRSDQVKAGLPQGEGRAGKRGKFSLIQNELHSDV